MIEAPKMPELPPSGTWREVDAGTLLGVKVKGVKIETLQGWYRATCGDRTYGPYLKIVDLVNDLARDCVIGVQVGQVAPQTAYEQQKLWM